MMHPARRQWEPRPRAPSRQKVHKRPSFEPHSAVTAAAGRAFGDQLDAQERPCGLQLPGGSHAITIVLVAERMNYIVFIANLMCQVSGRPMPIDDILRCRMIIGGGVMVHLSTKAAESTIGCQSRPWDHRNNLVCGHDRVRNP